LDQFPSRRQLAAASRHSRSMFQPSDFGPQQPPPRVGAYNSINTSDFVQRVAKSRTILYLDGRNSEQVTISILFLLVAFF
jgi:hypothetical protein